MLLATFIFPERVEWFLDYLEVKFKISKDNVFCYKNLDDESKLIFTFKLCIPENGRLNLKNSFPSGIPIHKKGDALYTINALNKLIDKMTLDQTNVVEYKSVKIDWGQYQNKFMLINGGELMFLNISRVF